MLNYVGVQCVCKMVARLDKSSGDYVAVPDWVSENYTKKLGAGLLASRFE
jgi:hypothetical protein